jgi:hypothetical protein
MVWPETNYHDVKARVDAGCGGTRYINSTMRDVLWIITAEMGVEKRTADMR